MPYRITDKNLAIRYIQKNAEILVQEWRGGVDLLAADGEYCYVPIAWIQAVDDASDHPMYRSTRFDLFCDLPVEDGILRTKLVGVHHTQNTVSLSLLDEHSTQEYNMVFMRCTGFIGLTREYLKGLVSGQGEVKVFREGNQLRMLGCD
eukprot:Lankesteria_metandrocarpae@DN3388_c0_g1_i1.p1